jgi:uncharacterized protein (DUF302 family)
MDRSGKRFDMAYSFMHSLRQVPFEEALARTRAALQAQGFGIPVEMDTRALFKAKLGQESENRVILGACLAAVAFEALKQEPELAVLLPCNVVVREVPGGCEVTAVSPEALFGLTEKGDPAYARVVGDKLKAALVSLS